MTSPSFKVDGAKEVQKALRGAENGVKDLKGVHKDAAQIVVDDAQPRARKLTGQMAASGRAAGQAAQGVARWGFARMPWVPIQHFGNPKHNISPNPFGYDALDARRDEVIESYLDGVHEKLEKNDLI